MVVPWKQDPGTACTVVELADFMSQRGQQRLLGQSVNGNTEGHDREQTFVLIEKNVHEKIQETEVSINLKPHNVKPIINID